MEKIKIIADLSSAFAAHSDQQVARAQSAYLQNKFNFFGIKKPLRADLQKKIFSSHRVHTSKDLASIIEKLWQLEEREFQYAALDLLQKYHKLHVPEYLHLFESLIRQKSWWDSVDLLASTHLGNLLKVYPELASTMDSWITDENLWIRRSALIYQLKHKEKTNEEKLFSYIRKTMHEKDFFIRKAIGWALRQYSKTNALAVKNFIAEHSSSLSPLSIREGSKYV